MRHRWIIPLLLVFASGVQAQQVPDSTYVRRIKQDVDTISKDNGRPAYVKRAQARIKARSDSIVANKVDTVFRVDTVYVQPKPPNPLSIAIHSNGTSVQVGSQLQLYAEVKNADGTPSNVPVSWGSNDKATISSTGLLTGKLVGTATVVAKADTFKTARDYAILAATDSSPPVPPDTVKPPKPDSIPPITAWVHPYPPQPNGTAYAEFPRDSVSAVVPPTTRTIQVQSLQVALDTAQSGDLLVIPSKSVTDNLAVKNTSRSGWVTIQGTDTSSAIRGTIGGAVAAVTINFGAHHVRFLGPLTIRAATDNTNAVIAGYGAGSVAQFPHHIIVDGVTVTSDNFQVRRCIWIDGQYIAVIRSRLINCSNKGADAQGILNAGGGPYRYQGNYIEGSHQCMMDGGANPGIPGDAASDIYFADNLCYKPRRWQGTAPYPGDQRQVKTVLETKSVRRLLVERNVFRNLWADAQEGFDALLKSENQGGDPLAQSKDITVRYNLFDSTASGLNIAAHPGSNPSGTSTRFTIYDNVWQNLSTVANQGICFQILDNVVDMALMHNTCSNATLKAVSFDGAPGVRTVFDNMFMYSGQYGVHGSGAGVGTGTINKWVIGGGGIWNRNVVVTTDGCGSYAGTSTTCSAPFPPGVGADTSKVPK